MEVSPLPMPDAEDSTEQFAATLHAQRQRAREFLSAQRERLHRAETDLSEQLQRIAVELAEDRCKTRQAEDELTQRTGQHQQQTEVLQQMKKDLAARQAEWEMLYRRVIEQQQSFADQLKMQQDEFARRQQDLLQQQSAAVAAENQLMQEKKELEAGRAELENERSRLDALHNSLQTRQAELEKRQRELEARAAETEIRRKRIARELKAQHAANLKEVELRQTELEQNNKADHSILQRRLELLREEYRVLKNKTPVVEYSIDSGEVERLEAEKKDLAARLADLEKQLAETRKLLADAQTIRRDDNENEEVEDVCIGRRYEMSIDEIRELKALNEELQQQLARLRQNGGGTAAQISSGVLNWEAEKQRILAALESDFEEENEEDQEEKLKIEDVIRKTDRVVAEKNREIGELRELLESQANNIGSMAVGAAALGQILDTDAVIQEERKNLAQLQEECREKLRHAEVENSLERAKIARERSQLDEKLRALKQQGIDLAITAENKAPTKPTRGRWLARLGLTDSEDENGN